jgi:tRNA1Val (adenine37-N6)-methyltransferase
MTHEHLIKDHVQCKQPKEGHRFSLDSLLLAQHVFPRKKSRILELGCGCGVISINIARRNPDVEIIGVDILGASVEIARENVRVNGMCDRITIIEKDLRTIKGDDFKRFQYVVCNPPFRRKDMGRPNIAYEKLIAREEIACSLDDILTISRKLLVNRGELNLIYPAGRIAEILAQMVAYNLYPTELIPIYTKLKHPAKWAIVKGRLNSRKELKIHAPLYPSSDHCP